VLGASTLWLSRDRPAERERRLDRLLGAVYLVPVAWGFAEFGLYRTVAPGLHSVGLWLAGVAVLAYGLTRWRNPNLSEQVRGHGADVSRARSTVGPGPRGGPAGPPTRARRGLVRPLAYARSVEPSAYVTQASCMPSAVTGHHSSVPTGSLSVWSWIETSS